MANINLVIAQRLSGEDFDIEGVDEDTSAGKLAEFLRKELHLPEHDGKGRVTYKLVLQRTGMLLQENQTLRGAGVQDRDTLSFWGEPVAAATALSIQRRLAAEYDKVMRRFGRHPNLTIEVPSHPPRVYTVIFRLKGPIERDANGELRFAQEHRLRITIPEGYPVTALPQAEMLTPAYHPNISSGRKVCIGSNYFTTETIADVIAKVGNYLQYREVGFANPYRSDIVTWILSEQKAGRSVGPFDNVAFDMITT